MGENEFEKFEGQQQEQQMSFRDKIEQKRWMVMEQMDAIDNKSSEEYQKLAMRLKDLNNWLIDQSEVDKNDAITAHERRDATEKHSIWGPTIITAGANLLGQLIGIFMNRANVKTVVKEEDNGGIVKSQATQFLQKPRN